MILILNESLRNRKADECHRNAVDVYNWYQHSKHISDSTRELIGSSKEELVEFLQGHSWIFRTAFNGLLISSRRPLVTFDPAVVKSYVLPFEVSRVDEPGTVENEIDLKAAGKAGIHIIS